MRIQCLVLVGGLCGALAAGAARAAELESAPVMNPIVASRGSVVVVHATLQNETPDVVYLNSASADIADAFAGADLLDDFAAAAPDSLLPGEGWEGPVLRLTLAADAPLSTSHRFGVALYGGDHRYDEQLLAELNVTLDDSLAISATPGPGAAADVGGLRVAPNPTRGAALLSFGLATAQAVRAEVYDVTGRVVRHLAEGVRPAGPQALTWDGRDDTGQRAMAGLYFIRVVTGSGTRRTKVIVVP